MQPIDFNRVSQAVSSFLSALGENPNREGLLETPRRVAEACGELFGGYGEDPNDHLRFFTDCKSDEIVLLRNISFTSFCEHHLLPFSGMIHFGYLPGPEGRVIGLSKLARIAMCYARRLQVQERLTADICHFLFDSELKPRAVGVVVSARHLCMGCRGVRQSEAVAVTSCLSGVFLEDPAARQEFFDLIHHSGGRE